VIAATCLSTSGLTELGARRSSSDEIGTDVRAGASSGGGAVDTVGGSVLAGVVSATNAGAVAARQRRWDGLPVVGRAVHLAWCHARRRRLADPRRARHRRGAARRPRAPHESSTVDNEITPGVAIPTPQQQRANEITGRVAVDVRR
jgi:hypothetical protein